MALLWQNEEEGISIIPALQYELISVHLDITKSMTELKNWDLVIPASLTRHA